MTGDTTEMHASLNWETSWNGSWRWANNSKIILMEVLIGCKAV
jgi:hypothetical protein